MPDLAPSYPIADADLALLIERIREIEDRIERLERIAYVTYDDVRRVAKYAYQAATWDPEENFDRPLKPMSKMRVLSEMEAARAGIDLRSRTVLKFLMRRLVFRVRHDALAIAQELVDRTQARAAEEQRAEWKQQGGSDGD